MSFPRRDFLKLGAAVGTAATTAGCRGPQSGLRKRDPDAGLADLARIGLEAAVAGGASYADVRISDHRRQRIDTREARVERLLTPRHRGARVRLRAPLGAARGGLRRRGGVGELAWTPRRAFGRAFGKAFGRAVDLACSRARLRAVGEAPRGSRGGLGRAAREGPDVAGGLGGGLAVGESRRGVFPLGELR